MSDQTQEQENEMAPEEPTFFIQVGGTAGAVVTPQMSAEDFIAGSKEQFQQIAQVVEVAAQSFIVRINKIASKPSNCTIEFGVNVGGEAGIPFVTKGTVGANFKVSICWESKD